MIHVASTISTFLAGMPFRPIWFEITGMQMLSGMSELVKDVCVGNHDDSVSVENNAIRCVMCYLG